MALTAEEQAELAQLQAQFGGQQPTPMPSPKPRGLSADEQAELAQLESRFGRNVPPPEQEKGLTTKAIDAALNTLDYAGGYTRYGAAKLAGVAKDEDWDRLGYGKSGATPTEDYLTRMGVTEGTSWSDIAPQLYSEKGDEWLKFQKGGTLDPNERDVAGFIGDVVLDPLTYATGGASALAKSANAGKILSSGSMLAKTGKKAVNIADTLLNPLTAAGKTTYKSGLKRIDQEVSKFGKEPVSDILLENNVAGSARSIYDQMGELADKYGKRSEGILKAAEGKGATVSMSEAMADTQKQIAQMRASRDPKLLPVADALENEVQKYLQLDPTMARTDISWTKPKVVEGSLPVQAGLNPSFTDVTIKPRDWKLGDLPKPSSHVEYKPTTASSFELGSLPVGGNYKNNVYPNAHPDFVYSSSKAPENFVPNPNVMTIEPTRTVTQASEYVARKPELTIEEIDRVLRGQTHPETFTKNAEVPYRYTEPQKAVPVNRVAETPAVGIQDANQYKQSIYGGLPKNSYMEQIGGKHPKYYAGEKNMARGLKEGVEKSVEKSLSPQQAKELKDINDQLGRLLTPAEKQRMQAFLEENKNLFTSMDPLMFGLDGKIGMAKKLADMLKFTGTRTRTGRALYNTGKKTGAEQATRRGAWEIMEQNEREKK